MDGVSAALAAISAARSGAVPNRSTVGGVNELHGMRKRDDWPDGLGMVSGSLRLSEVQEHVVARMKERRASGATHSFRLTTQAAAIVDSIKHPRRLGGKSRKVSEAIEWYFSPLDVKEGGKLARSMAPSPDNLVQNITGLQKHIATLTQSQPPPPTWRDRLRGLFGLNR